MSESTLLKPLAMGAIVVALDKFVMKNQNMNESLYFGLAGAVGAYGGAMVAKAMPLPLPSGDYFDGKTLEMRIAEIGIGAGVGYALNKYALKNDFNQKNMLNLEYSLPQTSLANTLSTICKDVNLHFSLIKLSELTI